MFYLQGTPDDGNSKTKTKKQQEQMKSMPRYAKGKSRLSGDTLGNQGEQIAASYDKCRLVALVTFPKMKALTETCIKEKKKKALKGSIDYGDGMTWVNTSGWF